MENIKMKLAIVALTRGGCRTARRYGDLLPQADIYLKREAAELDPGQQTRADERHFDCRLAELMAEIYSQYEGFVMIMATGIVVRTIAPYIVHKTQDPAVVVMDEHGRYVISLLSGHLGGANELAQQLADMYPCWTQAVITTSTDVNQQLAFDLLAKQNDCHIVNIEELKYISGALVNGQRVAVSCCLSTLPSEDDWPKELVDCYFKDVSPEPNLVVIDYKAPATFSFAGAEHILHLAPRCLALGVGCRRGVSARALIGAAEHFLASNKIQPEAVYKLCSIDIKANEPGLIALAEYLDVPFCTYSAAELRQQTERMDLGEYSAFVEEMTGTPSVSAAAAALGADRASYLLVEKAKYPGITFSLAKKKHKFNFYPQE